MYPKTTEKLVNLLKKSDIKNVYIGEEMSRIEVNDFVSKIANIYEKVRNAIEYKEDHLLRKSAIFRILQRKLMIKVSIEENIGVSLIKELIRGGYLENNFIPVSKADEIQQIFEKYLALANLSNIKKGNKNGNKVFKWLVELAACEIEESIMPPLANKALVEFMYKVMNPSINIADKNLSDDEKDLQVYLAVYKALVKSDASMVDYLLFKYNVKDWVKADHLRVMEVAKKLNNLKLTIENQRKHYAAMRLLRLLKKYTFAFHALREIILEKPEKAEEILNDPQELEYVIRETCNKIYKSSKVKLRRSIIRVTIYVFLTKMLLALVLEVPYDKYIAHEFFLMPVLINAIFPPVLIFLLGMIIAVPSKKNTNRVVNLVKEAVYKNRITGIQKGMGVSIKKKGFFRFVFNVLYFALFLVSFGVLITILKKLSFNNFSIFIFLLFLSVVSFFGIKMRMKIRELIVVDKKENPIVFLVNLFILPFLNVGHWISEKFAKINVFVFILDFIIEAPFKVFLEVIEDWISFLKEKKEEMYSKE